MIAAGAGAENMEFHTNNSVILTRDGSLDSRYRRSRLYIAAVALQPVVIQPEGSREIQGNVVDTGFHTGSFVLITVSTVNSRQVLASVLGQSHRTSGRYIYRINLI